MRKIIAAATFGLVLSVAGASNPYDQTPEGRAYMGFSFGGERQVPRGFHYGLRLDHDSRFVDGQVAPLMQIDFTRRGLNAANINGLSVLKQEYRLRQAEEPAAEEQPAEQPAEGVEEVPAEGAAAEEPGFFSRAWAGIKGMFGGGDEEEGPAEETPAEEPAEAPAEVAAGEEVTEGTFLNFNVVDWGLLAVGAVGLGFVAGEVSNGEETDDPSQGGAAPTTTGTVPTGTVPTTTGTVPTIGIPVSGFMALDPQVNAEMRERYEWLDGGTGHMGDLLPQDE